MVRRVFSSAVIWCIVLPVVFLFGAYCYQWYCYMVRCFISSADIWCVVLSIVLLYGA